MANSEPLKKIKAPTLKDVAKEAGVSIATVSHAVNNTGSMSADVKKKVQKVIKKLGYQPNKAARSMRTGKSMTIGLILPDFRYPLFPAIAREVEIAASKFNYSVIFVNSYADNKTEKDCFQRMLQMGVDGIIWFPGSQEDTVPTLAKNIPIIVLDRDLSNYDVSIPNHFQGGKLQAEHLLSLGHKRIGIISGPLIADNMILRIDGAKQVIEKAGLKLQWVCETGFHDLSPEAIQHILKKDVTAIIAGDDMIAINIYTELEKLDKDVHKNVSIIGFDNIAWADIVKPALTTINIPIKELAADSIDMLLARIEKPNTPRKKRVIDVSLVARHSVVKVTE
ncbi:MAG: LacI family DNA-binding transcriptional regulator [Aliiglaciecola sp.]|uniref:LacI family DNA-binding transcriptional regulator n=1 Tax=Aliiglaciecola sp. TaxID=1872441 RepID=UPI00329A32C4